MKDKTFETNLDILKDANIDKETKLFVILDMIHNQDISLNKGRELCTECGLFSDHWIAIDAKTTDVFSQKYETK